MVDKAISGKSRYERGRTRERMKMILENASSRVLSLYSLKSAKLQGMLEDTGVVSVGERRESEEMLVIFQV